MPSQVREVSLMSLGMCLCVFIEGEGVCVSVHVCRRAMAAVAAVAMQQTLNAHQVRVSDFVAYQ